ncbi:MAG TPA: hypothetical protein VND80_11890 [Steroidobacteraceae bacterium]|nr:hypothetical protein [Steroidobacteraceae bacterium]
MLPFLFIAAAMTAIAVAAVAVPLLQDRRNRIIAAVAALILVGAAGGLYASWSTWNWSAPAQPASMPMSPQIAAMIAKLEKHMHEHPDDRRGWVMLGRSYVATGRLDEAILAFDRALTLSQGKSLEATIGYGEALSLQAGGEITPQAAQLFEQAVTMAPTNPQALLYGGFAAAVRGDDALARSRWQALIAMNPPAPVVKLLNARIADLGPSPPTPPSQESPTATAAGAATAAAPASVTIRLAITPALRRRLKAHATLFVFAAEPGVQGPPLAVKRLSTAAIGKTVELSSADSLVPGRVLAVGEHVLLTARVSFDGRALPAAGDLYGELRYEVEPHGSARLLIDRIEP